MMEVCVCVDGDGVLGVYVVVVMGVCVWMDDGVGVGRVMGVCVVGGGRGNGWVGCTCVCVWRCVHVLE